MISDKDKALLLSLESGKKIDIKTLSDLFAYKLERGSDGKLKRKPPRVIINSRMNLKKGEYFNDKDIETTPGNLVLNKILIEPSLSKVLGYRNEEFTDSNVGKLNQEIANLLMEDKIKQEDYVEFMDNFQWIGLKVHPIFASSFTKESLIPDKDVIKEREKLLKEHKDAIEAGDSITMANIESKLLDIAKSKLKDDDGMYLYKSGARGKFGNNYKSISVMKGPILNPQSGEMEMVTQSFIEGIKKEDIHKMGNSVVTGAYPKAVGTAVAGYFTKKIIAMMQSVQIDQKVGSDCGSKNYLRTRIAKGQERDYYYRYVLDGGKLVELNAENIHKYVGKEIKMRSPQYCVTTHDGLICNKCAGNLYYKLGIYTLGLTSARASGTMLNLGMKAFHDSSAKTDKIDNKRLTI